MLMTDGEIQVAMNRKEIALEPFFPKHIQAASYDMCLGKTAFTSSMKETLDVSQKAVIMIEPGEFAVVESREYVRLDSRHAAQLGLRSEYAKRGLVMLSGPQIDPGFEGIIVVRLVNLARTRIAIAHEAPFLTVQFFQLNQPVEKPYTGAHQGQRGITAKDIQALAETEGLTLGQIIKTLSALAVDVAELRGSVSKLSWSIPLIVALGIAIVGIIVMVK